MKKKSRFFVVGLICAVFVLGVLGQPASAATGKIVVRVGSAFEAKHILVQVGNEFKKLVEKASNGRIEVQLFVGGVMGSEEELSESVSVGGVEMQVGGGLPIKQYAPEYYFFDGPYVMKDWPHFKRVWDSPLGQKTRDMVEKRGNTKYLGIVYRGMRQFTSKKPIYTPEDLTGLKLRLPQIPAWVAVWKAVGALPVPIALTELFTSLQMGVADASEGDVTQIHSFHLNEVQKYLTFTNHLVQTGAMTINKKFFDKLSKADQDILIKAGKEACEWGTNEILTGETQLIIKLQKAGMQTVIPDAALFREKAKPAVEDLFKTTWKTTTWKEILAQ